MSMQHVNIDWEKFHLATDGIILYCTVKTNTAAIILVWQLFDTVSEGNLRVATRTSDVIRESITLSYKALITFYYKVLKTLSHMAHIRLS